MKHIAILGCGPAGLLAGWAAAESGHIISVFSSKAEMSKLGGAQYLHTAIPGVTSADPETLIEYVFRGDPAIYQRKVYGSKHVPFVSFGLNKSEQPAWNLNSAYSRLWKMLSGDKTNELEIDAHWLKENHDKFGYVFSTIPLKAICLQPWLHQFWVQKIHISLDPDVHDSIPTNTILWDGTLERSWYRCSNLFGHHGTEWGQSVVPPYPGLIVDRKPIGTNCDCWSGTNVRLMGRRGTWSKGILTHHAYFDAMEVLHEMY